MNNETCVSVIIPTKNRPDMLVRAVDSVRMQSHADLEIIIIDDGSEDNTREAIKVLKEKDSRIAAIHNLRSLGGSGARNIGIKHSKGEFVSFLDDDDEWLPEKVEKQLSFLKSHPNLIAVSCWYIVEKMGKVQKMRWPPIVTFKDLLWENFLGSFSFCMASRRAFEEIGLLDESLPSGQDWDFWLRVALRFEVGVVPEYLALYHRHYQQKISSSFKDRLIGHERIYSKYGNYITQDCRKHHLKYIYFYKSLSSHSLKDKSRYLAKMFRLLSGKGDLIRFFVCLCYAVFPGRWISIIKKLCGGRLMLQIPLVLERDIYNRSRTDNSFKRVKC